MLNFKPIPVDIGKSLEIDDSSPTGLRWKDTSHCRNRVVQPGNAAGYWDEKSTPAYYKVIFKGTSFKAHRVIWFLHTKKDPEHLKVDHIDQNRRNNVVSNLRLATSKESCDNRGVWGKVKYRGVSWSKSSSCYVSSFRDNGITEKLGLYETPEQAALAWDYRAIQSGNTFKILNFPDATDAERLQAVSSRIRQRGTFYEGKKLIGVSYDKERKLFQAYVKVPVVEGKDKMVSLGRYKSAYEAAKVRDQEILRLGLNKKLNFPNEMK